MVFTLGLPKAYAYFLPKYEKIFARDIINKITYLFIGMGVVFSALLFSCSGLIADILKNPDLSLALRYFSPTPLFLLPTIGLEGIYATYRKTQFITIYVIATKVLSIGLIVLPVFLLNGTYLHAIIGFDAASIITCVIALIMKNYPVRKESHENSDLTYKQILKFSLPLLSATIWGTIIASSTQFFISRYYGNEVFADFSNGFMEIPFASMVLAAIAAILLPRFSEVESGEKMNFEVYNLWKSSLEKSAKIIFPILIFSVVFARLIMICLYGNVYGTSSVYFIIKNLSSLFYIVPFAPIMLAIGKTNTYSNIHLIIALIIVAAELICVKTLDSPVAVAIASEICQVLKIYLMMRVISIYANRSISELIPLKSLSRIIVACLLAALLVYYLTLPISINKWLLLVICGSLFSLLYFVFCWVLKISYRDVVSGLIPSFSKFSLLKYLP